MREWSDQGTVQEPLWWYGGCGCPGGGGGGGGGGDDDDDDDDYDVVVVVVVMMTMMMMMMSLGWWWGSCSSDLVDGDGSGLRVVMAVEWDTRTYNLLYSMAHLWLTGSYKMNKVFVFVRYLVNV